MSCNGCRVLRKGCSENCLLRQCLQCLDNPQAQAHATVFVAKFFGRAGLLSFISSVPQSQRPALFQSLLFEAVGRAINPVSGAVGLLWSGNWQVCESAVQTVLRGGSLQPLPEFSGGASMLGFDNLLESERKRKGFREDMEKCVEISLGLCLNEDDDDRAGKRRRAASPSSEESETTTSGSGCSRDAGSEKKLLRLFV
ncbi:hypothetical protein SLE2022_205400 [Rubroshorea leprosula]